MVGEERVVDESKTASDLVVKKRVDCKEKKEFLVRNEYIGRWQKYKIYSVFLLNTL